MDQHTYYGKRYKLKPSEGVPTLLIFNESQRTVFAWAAPVQWYGNSVFLGEVDASIHQDSERNEIDHILEFVSREWHTLNFVL